MQIKAELLTGKALDWAIAKSEGLSLVLDPMSFSKGNPDALESGWWVWMASGNKSGHRCEIIGKDYSPSTNWAQGGPIIEREHIDTFYAPDGSEWCAQSEMPCFAGSGETLLGAAMRCYVSSRLGEEIEMPDEFSEVTA